MESGGEVVRSVLRVGGWAGILGGVILVVGLIIVFLGPPPPVPPNPELDLTNFLANPTPLVVTLDLALVALLLILPFLAALYWSLREPSRVFARIGLGSGVLATVLLIIAVAGILQANITFSALYDRSPIADQPLAVAAFAAVQSLITAVAAAGGYLIGLAFVAFALAMRASPDYQEGLAWLSAGLGIIIVLLPLLNQALVSFIFVAVLAIVLGWKVYSLSTGA